VASGLTDVLYLDFLNSEFRDFRGRWVRDNLQNEEWLTAFLQRWHLSGPGPIDSDTLQALIALRSCMRRIVESLPERAPRPEDLAELNDFMQHVSNVPQLQWDGEQYHLELLPVQKNWLWVMAEIALSFADLLTHEDTRRLKICENNHCRGIFYDESKSRTRRYCTSDKCGNLLKLRRFRARHR
jgi:predicted RNA-binding Zn ribbon-like protein